MPHHKWSQKQWLGMLFYLPVPCLLPVAEQGAREQLSGASQPASQPARQNGTSSNSERD